MLSSGETVTVSPEAYWNYLFPYANSFYTLDSFLQAASRFPAFCNEPHEIDSYTSDIDDMCAKELSALFAHITTETGTYSSHESTNYNQDGVERYRWGLHCID